MLLGRENFGVENDAAGESLSKKADIVDAIDTLTREINQVADQLAHTLSTSITAASEVSLGQISFAIFVAFVGALSAYIFNHLHWKTVNRNQRLKGIRTAIFELVSKLESLAVSYWLRGYDENMMHDLQVAEVEIKANMRLIAKLVRIIPPEALAGITKEGKQKIDDFPSEMYDLITGDGFESRSRKISKSKATQITRHCSELKVILAGCSS